MIVERKEYEFFFYESKNGSKIGYVACAADSELENTSEGIWIEFIASHKKGTGAKMIKYLKAIYPQLYGMLADPELIPFYKKVGAELTTEERTETSILQFRRLLK
jgi:hypothetical protein